MHGAHKSDPITGASYTFLDPYGRAEWTAQQYFELGFLNLVPRVNAREA